MSDRRRNALLATIRSEPEPANRTGDTFSSLFQETKRQQGAQLIYRLDRLEGSSEPFVAYRPENLLIRVFHDRVTPASFGFFSVGSHHSTYRWSFPDLGTPIAVTVDNPDPDVAPVFDDVFVSTGQTEAVLELQVEVGTRTQGSGEVFTVVGQFLLNGQPVLNLDTTGGTVQRDASGGVTNQASLPIVPIFEHPASGSFHLSADKDGQSILDEAYIQRGLEWAQPWPNLENLPLDQPIQFSNVFQWDGGDPLDADDGPRWRATVAGINYPPNTSTGMPQYNSGSQVAFTFNPDEPQVTARARASGSSTITLLPDDSNVEYPSLEAWRQARQAREDCPAVAFYSVEGQAITYDAPPTLYTTTRTFNEKVAARVRKVFVTGTRFEPNPIVFDPSQAQPVTLKAEVASCLFVEPQIRWSLKVRGERLVDPEDPGQGVEGYDAFVAKQDWQDFTEDYTLEVPWNGQDPDGRPLPRGTYPAELLVDVREKSRVDRNGNVIMLPARGTADLEVQGAQRLDITDFTATPSSFPAQTGQSVAFDAHATVSGFTLDEPPTVRWTLHVSDPNGNPMFQTSQEGLYQLAYGESMGLPPLAAGLYPVELEAVATDPNDPSLTASDTASLVLQVGSAGGRSVTITDFHAVPPAFDPGHEETAQFSARVHLEGYQTSQPAITWRLAIDQNGTTLFSDEGDPLASISVILVAGACGVAAGTPLALSVDGTILTRSWDGTYHGEIVANGTYRATLVAEACESPGVASLPGDEAFATDPSLCATSAPSVAFVTVNHVIIEILPFGEGSIVPIPHFALATSGDQAEYQEEQLGKVYDPYLEPRVTVRLYGNVSQPGSQSPAPRVTVRVSSYLSNPSGFNLTLTRDDFGETYTGTLDLSTVLRELPPGSFTTADAWLPEHDHLDSTQAQIDSGEFRRFAKNSGGSYCGRALTRTADFQSAVIRGYRFNELDFEEKDHAALSLSYLRSCGYEVVQVTYGDLPDQERALVRVKNQPALFYYSGHGDHKRNEFTGHTEGLGAETPERATAGRDNSVDDDGGITSKNWNKLRGVIIAGCSLLDINDYNGFWAGYPSRQAVGFQPGLEWRQITGQGRATLAGYGIGAPKFPVDSDVLVAFESNVGSATNFDAWPKAWLRANARVDLLDGAVVIDRDYYYFISYKERKETVKPAQGDTPALLRIFHTDRQLTRIHRSQWLLPNPSKHQREFIHEGPGDNLDDTDFYVQDLP